MKRSDKIFLIGLVVTASGMACMTTSSIVGDNDLWILGVVHFIFGACIVAITVIRDK